MPNVGKAAKRHPASLLLVRLPPNPSSNISVNIINISDETVNISPSRIQYINTAIITGSQPLVLLSSEDCVFCRQHPQRQTSSVLPYRNIPWLRLSHPGLQSVGVLRPPPALHCGLHYAVRAYITQG